MPKGYYVYILACRRNGTLYIDVTNDIARRMEEHHHGEASAFTRKHGVHTLVYLESFTEIDAAIARKTRLKKYKREWKINLIEAATPGWRDLLAAR